PLYGAQKDPVPGQPLAGQPAVPQVQAQAARGPWPLPAGQPPLLQAGQPLPPALQQLLAALGLPAPAVAPAVAPAAPPSAPVAQVAPAAPGGGVEVRRVQDPTKSIRRIHTKVDNKVAGPIYKGTSPGELSVSNNPVLFQDKLSKMLSTSDGGIWTLTVDRLVGSSYLRPAFDRMSPLRRELLQEFVGDTLATYDELMSTELVEVPSIDGSFSRVPAREVSATEWLRKLVREGMRQSGA
ncbi:unnamed protein product, partial [Laminaria digitata]